MIKNIDDYFEKLNIGSESKKRVKLIIDFYYDLNFAFDDIFITDFLDKENNRHLENLWLLNKKEVIEAKNFLMVDDFDYINYINQVLYWRIKKEEFIKKATQSSKLEIHIDLACKIVLNFKATGYNCNYLYSIFKKYFIGFNS